jgi:hypothetical protein
MHEVESNVMAMCSIGIEDPISVISGSISADQIMSIYFDGRENPGQLLSDKLCSAGIESRFFALTRIPRALRKAGDFWGNMVMNGLKNELLD